MIWQNQEWSLSKSGQGEQTRDCQAVPKAGMKQAGAWTLGLGSTSQHD